MSTAVELTIISTQQQDGASDKSRMKAKGTLEYTSEGYILSYTEPDSEMGNCVSHIKFHSSGKVELCRTGAYCTRFLIEEGKTHTALYKSPFGEMDMEISASRVRTDISLSGGRVHLEYKITSNSQLIGENTLLLDIKKI